MYSTKISALRVEDRPREILASQGKEFLRLEELLAILIGSGIPSLSALGIAQSILETIDFDLNRLGLFTTSDFMNFRGIGVARASILIAALELGRRRAAFHLPNDIPFVRSSKDAYDLFQPKFLDLGHEEFWVIHLNRAARLLKIERISTGGIAGTVVDVKMIFKSAIGQQASSLILAHNHPSGQKKPSQADRDITKKIVEAGRLFEIAVADHLIMAGNTYVSFADEGWM
jgi:DNA repair protein RadC